jgi:hypothetical protein
MLRPDLVTRSPAPFQRCRDVHLCRGRPCSHAQDPSGDAGLGLFRMSVLSLGKLPWGVGWARCGGHELERRITIRIREPGRHPCTYLYPVLPRKDPDLPDDPCCSGRAGSPWPCNGCQPAGLRPCCSFLRLTLHPPVQPPPDHRMRRPSVMPIRMRVTSFAEPAVSSITGWRTHTLSPHGGLSVASSLPT